MTTRGLEVAACYPQYRKKYGPHISVRLSMQNVRKDADLLNLPPPFILPISSRCFAKGRKEWNKSSCHQGCDGRMINARVF